MSLSIKDVVSISGSPGLFQILKSNDNVIVVESMDDRKRRQLIKGNMMVSKLMDVSIYTDDDSEPLVNVLKQIKEKFGTSLPVSKKSSKDDLMGFLGEVLPNFDRERVYPSNVKKLISWYGIINAFDVDLDWEEEDSDEDSTDNKAEENKIAEDK